MSSTSKLTTSNGSRNCGISDELQTKNQVEKEYISRR